MPMAIRRWGCKGVEPSDSLADNSNGVRTNIPEKPCPDLTCRNPTQPNLTHPD